MLSPESPKAVFIDKDRQPLVVILGPTAVGKTELAIRIAERMNGEIVSADSRLFYRGMDIGTAKPNPEEQRRVPHHLIDVAEPDDTWSLAQFQAAAHTVIKLINQRGRLPLLVGGTGQYIHAITQGWDIPKVKPDHQLRQVLANWAAEITPDGLHERLAMLDPLAAQTIDPRNVRRTIRALEVILSTGARFSDQKKRGIPPYRVLQIGLTRPRSDLYARIDQRIEYMVQNGFIEEVNNLLEQGYSSDLPTMSAIGYSEICMVIQGKISLEEAVINIKRSTRKYVRRQANWFKLDDPEIQWFQCNQHTVADVQQTIQVWLSKTQYTDLIFRNPGN